ncbi:MAG TPA: CHRD domain-containing protein [Nitrospirota bacterium]|nr:CHRD domain-containing protein [Nitrospirota bacterium]
MRTTLKLILLAVLTIVLNVSLAMAASHEFKAKLSGKQVTPAVTTKAEGSAEFKLSKDGKELTYHLKVEGIENVTAAHIHTGKMGENGGPVAGLFAGPKKEGKFHGVLAKGTITDNDLVGPLAGKTIADLVAMIKDGSAYVNVHTDKYPDGEIRGQIKSD